MKFSLSQSVFFLLFFPLFFLLLIFGETPFGIFLLGVVAAVLLFFSSYLSFSHLGKVSRYFMTMLSVMILIAGASLLVTLSIPLSVNKFVFLVFSGVCFVFFAAVRREWFTEEMFSYGLVLVGCVLSIMTTLFLFFPELVRFLPSLNLLTANYGHNHAAIYFLFVLPLAFFLWKEKTSWWHAVPFLVILVGLLLSFGRVTIVLALLELVMLWKFSPKRLPQWFSWLFLPFIGILIFFAVMSVFPQLSEKEHCIIPVFQTQLCKPLVHETRTAYWSQAIRATLQRPVLGWGGGTFALVSKRFYNHPSEFSAYAHNEYLQHLAEYGIVGSIALFVFLLPMLHRSVLMLRQRSSSFVYFLSIALLTLSLDAVFDYNWNYVGIWTVFLIGIAVFSRQEEVEKSSGAVIKKISWLLSKYLIRWIWIGMSVSILVWSGAYLTHLVARALHHYDFSQRVFPFVYWEAEEDMHNNDISFNTKTFIFHLYRQHNNVITAYITNLPSEQDKRPLYKQLITVEPLNFSSWKRLLNDDLDYRDVTSVVEDLRALNNTFAGTRKYNVSDFDKKSFFDPFISSLNTHLFSVPDQVAEAYVESYRFYPFLPSETRFEMLQYPERYSAERVSWVLSQVPEKELWQYKDSLYKWRLHRLRAALQQSQYTEVERILPEIWEHTAWQYQAALKLVFQEYIQQIKYSRSVQQPEKAIPVVASWANILQTEPPPGEDTSVQFDWSSQVAEQALLIGKEMLHQQPEQAAQLYVLANQVSPGSISYFPFTPESAGTTATSSEVMFVQSLLKSEEGRKVLSPYHFLKLLQRVANTLVTEQKDVEAIEVLRAMNQLFIRDYIGPAQLGNYYYLKGNAAQAERELQQCINIQKELGITQSSCYEGIAAAAAGRQDTDKWYWDTAQLILQQ